MSFEMMQYVVDDYKRQLESRRIPSNVIRIRSLQKEEERLYGRSSGR